MADKENSPATREYKDRLFKFIFGNPDKKEWTLSLYNAINGSHYQQADDIDFTTIKTAVYMKMRNDVSFLVDNIMSFYEQQSSFNPNMPMRFLIYAGMVYSNYTEQSDYNIYSEVQQHAPTPKCVCLYNGEPNKDDITILKLSDSFDKKSDIEVTVTMININHGHNKTLMESCKPLAEYSWFVSRVRELKKQKRTLDEAIDIAIDELPEDSLIKPLLVANKAEVKRMCITEYDEEKTMAKTRAESEAIGFLKALFTLVKDGDLTVEKAAKKANMTIPEFEAKLAQA